MKLRPLRAGELIALVGAVCVAVALALPWYDSPRGHLGAWSTFGPAVAILIVAAALALFLAIATVTERSPAIPVAATVWSSLGGIAAVICAVVRVLERPSGASGAAVGAWLALGGAAALLAGSWHAMRDERTSTYDPPVIETRPAPAVAAVEAPERP
jgi:Na+/melibiose symporter-like transporter